MSAIHIPFAFRSRWVACMLGVLLTLTAAGQYGTRPDGRPLERLAVSGTKAVVLFFVATDCPVSNRTFPEMKRLRLEFQARGVAVWFVYSNTGERGSVAAEHQREYDGGGEFLLDPDGDLVRLARAQVTPEISVLIAQSDAWKPVYTGRIDDKFVHIGLERPRATRHFAEEALKAVLDGRLVPRATGKPVGCAIVTGGARP